VGGNVYLLAHNWNSLLYHLSDTTKQSRARADAVASDGIILIGQEDREMKAATLIGGIILGVILTAIIGWQMAPGLMLSETPSPYGVEETAARLKQKALEMGWVVPSIAPLNKSIKKHGGGTLPPIRLVNLCEANHAYRILKDDQNKFVSVMMPCTISVYEKSDGKAYIGSMNAGLLGKVFGGEIAAVMSGPVAEAQQAFIRFAVQK
jgi:uncharacterized protein (DUF302 family)